MTQAPKSSNLLSRVQNLLRMNSLLRAGGVATAIVLAIALIAVATWRMTGLIPITAERPLWLLAIPAVASLLTWMFYRRVTVDQAARAVDQHAQTKDLFLTLSSLDSSAGEYQPLVALSAEEKAEAVIPKDVVRFRFADQLAVASVLAILFALVVVFVPELDPFGRQELAAKEAQQVKEIDYIKKEARKKKERLDKQAEQDAEESDQLDDLVKQMMSDFRKMEPMKRKDNARVLTKHRNELNDTWRNSAEKNKKLREAMNQPISKQQIGQNSRSAKMNQMLDELKDGKTDTLRKELAKAQETMQKMAEAKTPEEKEKLQQELKKELKDLQKFVSKKAGSKELNEALSQAMKSLEVCQQCENGEQGGEKGEQLSKDAMEALKESLELSDKQMEKMAQAAQDMKKLEDALKTLQQAQKLNQKGELDGSQCEGCETLEDYEELYKQMMADAGGGGQKDGKNQVERGAGAGGETEYDDSEPEGYKKEKEKPLIQQGKILLSIKTKEYAEEKDFDPDQMREYQKSVDKLKSSVQSAIDTEEIPPGYVKGIKGYFDKIENVDPKLKK